MAITQRIVAGADDDVLAPKRNQKGLADDVVRLFEWTNSLDFAYMEHDYVRMVTKGHRRV